MMATDGRSIPDDDVALDAMLASWAERHAPSPENLVAIRRAARDEGRAEGADAAAAAAVGGVVLPLEWWESFFVELQEGVRRAANLDATAASAAAAAGCAA